MEFQVCGTLRWNSIDDPNAISLLGLEGHLQGWIVSKSPDINKPQSGRRALPQSRRLVTDVLALHRTVPTCAHDRICSLAELALAREQASVRISWAVLFIKAFARVAARHSVLQQTYHPWPWPHVFQHARNVAMVATHREFAGESWLFWSKFRSPEEMALVELQARLDHFLSEPVDRVFRRQWQFSFLPTPLRRLIFSWNMHFSGAKRAERMGTFFLTTIAAKGCEIQHPPGFLTANLTYGPLDALGECRVTIAYDHRLMDGSFVADRLCELEEVLCSDITEELWALPGSRAAA